jgi:hypothetical protein
MHYDAPTTPLPVSSAEPSGDLSTPALGEPGLWQQVDAFRELLQEGGQLLSEVLLFTKSAEESLAMLDREKQALDREREALRQEREQACREVELATSQLHLQQEELAVLREKLAANEVRLELQERVGAGHDRSLQKALCEAEERARSLEEELRSTRAQQALPERICVEEPNQPEEARLRSLENELEQTRLILASERLRRNRAISLIRPSAGQEAQR